MIHPDQFGVKEFCRHKPTHITSIRDIELYGASESQITNKPPQNYILLNLTGSKFRWGACGHVFPAKYKDLQSHVVVRAMPDEIVLDVPDMSYPPVLPSFYEVIIDNLTANGRKSLVAFCIGGHGRTGTFLAAMLIVHQKVTSTDAINMVRSKLCQRCVESYVQREYLWQLASSLGIAQGPLEPFCTPKTVTQLFTHAMELPNKKVRKTIERKTGLLLPAVTSAASAACTVCRGRGGKWVFDKTLSEIFWDACQICVNIAGLCTVCNGRGGFFVAKGTDKKYANSSDFWRNSVFIPCLTCGDK